MVSFPAIAKILFPKIITSFPAKAGELFLTFDDGPEPEVTPLVLNILDQYNIKATFFCTGQKVEKYPQLFAQMVQRGHSIGNHGYLHLNGWKTGFGQFIENVEKCQVLTGTNLYRPPYGKITPKQYQWLIRQYHIIAWNVMTFDFAGNTNPRQCLNIISKYTRGGSIIVFHDTPVAINNLLPTLADAIELLQGRGFNFASIRC